ncbi:MAG: hypothetical protein L0I76_34985 [Pseudonocardia sp.]|nr:hypothetical protein [Pseudonocardia sp.]
MTTLAERKSAKWVDEVAVGRWLRGEFPGRALTHAERIHAARAQHDRWIAATARRLNIPEDQLRDGLAA